VLFSSFKYFLFLPIVVTLYWCLPSRFRKPLLLLASYYFYMSWLPVYGALLFSLTLANYLFGLMLERNRKKSTLTLAIVLNLGALCYYKYATFLLDAFCRATNFACHLVSKPAAIEQLPVLNIILPLGISFFVFEFIHYIVDVYRGAKAIHKPLDFFVFASFFPSQISGPIKRYQDFDKQLNEPKTLQRDDIYEGLGFFLKGMFKKSALADNLAPITALGVTNAHNIGSLDAWIVMVAFVLQVYFDFSGYTDIGIGSARLMGIQLPNNFNLPYIFSRNMIEFWQRWHITLTLWLRDYLLTPITGFRASKLRFHIGTMVTMTACGLWHGAAWHFVVWGFLHGLLMVATREYQQVMRQSEFLRRVHAHKLAYPIAVIGTLFQWMLVAAFFLAKSVQDALSILFHMFVFVPGAAISTELVQSPFLVAFAMYCIWGLIYIDLPWLQVPSLKLLKAIIARRNPTRLALYAACFAAAVAFTPGRSTPFIYFQF
jgi:D-alanyl-lipoteichoic acid acyltransferase DltB (MBOAT superfamily)